MKNLSIRSIIASIFLIVLFSCADNKTKNDEINKSLFFNEGDRVCFVGNSITHGGIFHHNIYLYNVTRFPNRPLKMYNCGVSGDVTWGVLDRMEDDILINKPTHAVIMLGMNDVQRNLYGPNITANKDTLRRRKEAVDYYKTNLDSIVNIFLSKNIEVILERPSIYDQTAILEETNHFGVNDVLGECAVYIDSLAIKYKLETVDYFTIMNEINLEMQAKDPSATITCEDRIHPGETGHFIMAYQFLKSDNAPKYISRIVVDMKKMKSSDESYNCTIGEVRKLQNAIEFAVTENALPFPVNEGQQEAVKLVPFVDDFNVELFKTINLTDGNYILKIDDVVVSTFSHEQLNAGINLAEYNSTPQFQQAKKVRDKFEEMWKMEGKLRGMKFIEYMGAYKACPNKDNLQFVETFLDSVFTKNYTNPYYKNQLKIYISNKPNEVELLQKSEVIRNEVYKIAQPKEHVFLLELVNSNVASAGSKETKAIPFIFDTDMMTDCDDAGALAVAHALADNGELEILGVALTTCDRNNKHGNVVSAINYFYNRPNIPIAMPDRNDMSGIRTDSCPFSEYIYNNYSHDNIANKNREGATTMYRRLLSKADDNSVVIVAVGQFFNIEDLLRSSGDSIDSRNGVQLVAAKVKELVVTGGWPPLDPRANKADKNFGGDPGDQAGPATHYVFEHWPHNSAKIIISTARIGISIITGPAYKSYDSPMRAAYERAYDGINGRPSWDQTAVLIAARGLSYNNDVYWKVEDNGYAFVDNNGIMTWYDSPDKNHEYLLLHSGLSDKDMGKVISDLMSHLKI